MITKGPKRACLAALAPRFFPPFGQFLDRNGAFGVKSAIAAAWATHREFVGQRIKVLYRNERLALPARHYAALVAGLSQKLDALCRHWRMSPFSVGKRCQKISAGALRTRTQFCESGSAIRCKYRARPIALPPTRPIILAQVREPATRAACQTDQISMRARRARSGRGMKRGRDRRWRRCNPYDQSYHMNIPRGRRGYA